MLALDSAVQFPCGTQMKNRFMLAPMTNTQSHEDGRLSEEELHWLSLRAKGQFGLVMTCAAHVQAIGKGFPGQLGIFGTEHLEGHQRLAASLKAEGSLAVVQLHHAGMRSPRELLEASPVCPSDNEKHGARGLSLEEVYQLREDFIQAAVWAQQSGYDGVEVHGAHGYILTQFLSASINHRTDIYGGSLENRARLLFEIINGIRTVCGTDFLLGVRLSPERFGMQLGEVKIVCQRLIDEGVIDFLDVSLWDVFKQPEGAAEQSKSLLQHFTELDRKQVRLTVAGKIRTGQEVQEVLAQGVDFVGIGRAGILHHDYPVKVMQDPNFEPIDTPVSVGYLHQEGLSDQFVSYMRRWPDFVAGEE